MFEQLVAKTPPPDVPLDAPLEPDDPGLVAAQRVAQSAAQSRTLSIALVTTDGLVETSKQVGCE